MPKYLDARNRLREFLSREKLREGDALPAIPKLAVSLRVGRSPLCRAIRMLAEEGVLRTVPGSGCYVRKAMTGSISPATAHVAATREGSILDAGPIVSRKPIRIAVLGDLPRLGNAWRQIIETCNRYYDGLAIELVPIRSYEETQTAGLGQTADIFQIPVGHLPYWVQSNRLFNPEEAGGLAVDENEFYPGLIQACQYDGHLWGVPITASIEAHFCRSPCFQAIESLLPFEGFWDYLEKLRALEDSAAMKPFRGLLASDKSILSLFMATGGQDLSSLHNEAQFSRPDFRGFLEKLEPFYRDRRLFCQEDCVEGRNVQELFIDGEAALAIGCSMWVRKLAAEIPDTWRLLPSPVEPDGGLNAFANLAVISALTLHPVECREILEVLAQGNSQRRIAAAGANVAHRAANQSFHLRWLDEPAKQVLLADYERAQVFSTCDPTPMYCLAVIVNDEIRNWRAGRLSVPQLCETLDKKVRFYRRALRQQRALADRSE